MGKETKRSPDMPHPAMAELTSRLATGLNHPLPGAEAQALLAPRPVGGDPLPPDPEGGRPAAGLVLLYPREHAPQLVLTVRSRHLPTHSGQVSLPGGLKEEEENLPDTAIREAEEEIGVDPAQVRIMGELSPVFIPPSGFRLHPFVGVAQDTLRPSINSTEVARILEVPLSALLDRNNLRREIRNFRGQDFEVPFYFLEGEKIWGATAMILAELVWILKAGHRSEAPG